MGELIGEAVLAMEYGASAEDVARTCHAHPVCCVYLLYVKCFGCMLHLETFCSIQNDTVLPFLSRSA